MKPYTFDELRQARAAHSAYNHGSRTPEHVAGERVYQRLRKRQQRQQVRPVCPTCQRAA